MSRFTNKRTVDKLIKSAIDLDSKKWIYSDEEFTEIILKAEEKYGLTEKEQDSEIFFTDAKRRLQDYFSEMWWKK